MIIIVNNRHSWNSFVNYEAHAHAHAHAKTWIQGVYRGGNFNSCLKSATITFHEANKFYLLIANKSLSKLITIAEVIWCIERSSGHVVAVKSNLALRFVAANHDDGRARTELRRSERVSRAGSSIWRQIRGRIYHCPGRRCFTLSTVCDTAQSTFCQ